jgi:hypothetical protein
VRYLQANLPAHRHPSIKVSSFDDSLAAAPDYFNSDILEQ